MTRFVFAIALAMLVSLPVEAAEFDGVWTAIFLDKHPDRLTLSLKTDDNGNQRSGFEISGFTGLSRAQIESATRIPVAFQMVREAGTVHFDGTFRDGRGAGEFRFVSDPGYADRLRSVGVQLGRENTGRDLMNLALFDVSIDFIRSMQAIGYDETLDQYVAFRIFGVDPDYVREMGKVGFKDLSSDRLVETKIHGATPEYIREMRAKGEDLSLDDYIQSRIFQITPEFSNEMAHAGYPNTSHDTLVQFKIHGVTPEFIAELKELGYTKLPAERLVEMRIHGVTPEFIRRVEKAGYHKVPVDKLVQMRIFDIEPEMIRALDDAEH